MNFLFSTFLVSISGLPFIFTKIKSFTFSMLIELGYKRAAKTDIRIMCNESCVKTEHK